MRRMSDGVEFAARLVVDEGLGGQRRAVQLRRRRQSRYRAERLLQRRRARSADGHPIAMRSCRRRSGSTARRSPRHGRLAAPIPPVSPTRITPTSVANVSCATGGVGTTLSVRDQPQPMNTTGSQHLMPAAGPIPPGRYRRQTFPGGTTPFGATTEESSTGLIVVVVGSARPCCGGACCRRQSPILIIAADRFVDRLRPVDGSVQSGMLASPAGRQHRRRPLQLPRTRRSGHRTFTSPPVQRHRQQQPDVNCGMTPPPRTSEAAAACYPRRKYLHDLPLLDTRYGRRAQEVHAGVPDGRGRAPVVEQVRRRTVGREPGRDETAGWRKVLRSDAICRVLSWGGSFRPSPTGWADVRRVELVGGAGCGQAKRRASPFSSTRSNWISAPPMPASADPWALRKNSPRRHRCRRRNPFGTVVQARFGGVDRRLLHRSSRWQSRLYVDVGDAVCPQTVRQPLARHR